jgi:uncharacterized Zn-binding protein involved in type VI secretion
VQFSERRKKTVGAGKGRSSTASSGIPTLQTGEPISCPDAGGAAIERRYDTAAIEGWLVTDGKAIWLDSASGRVATLALSASTRRVIGCLRAGFEYRGRIIGRGVQARVEFEKS